MTYPAFNFVQRVEPEVPCPKGSMLLPFGFKFYPNRSVNQFLVLDALLGIVFSITQAKTGLKVYY